MKLTLLGNPKSTNHIYKMSCRGKFAKMYMTKEGKDLKESYAWQARLQRGKFFDGEIKMIAKLYFGDNRKRDVDNHSKLLLDSLSGEVYKDDKQIMVLHLEKHYDKENPRIEVEIEEMT